MTRKHTFKLSVTHLPKKVCNKKGITRCNHWSEIINKAQIPTSLCIPDASIKTVSFPTGDTPHEGAEKLLNYQRTKKKFDSLL